MHYFKTFVQTFYTCLAKITHRNLHVCLFLNSNFIHSLAAVRAVYNNYNCCRTKAERLTSKVRQVMKRSRINHQSSIINRVRLFHLLQYNSGLKIMIFFDSIDNVQHSSVTRYAVRGSGFDFRPVRCTGKPTKIPAFSVAVWPKKYRRGRKKEFIFIFISYHAV